MKQIKVFNYSLDLIYQINIWKIIIEKIDVLFVFFYFTEQKSTF